MAPGWTSTTVGCAGRSKSAPVGHWGTDPLPIAARPTGKITRASLEARVASGRGRDLCERCELAPPGWSRAVQRRQLPGRQRRQGRPRRCQRRRQDPRCCASSPARATHRRLGDRRRVARRDATSSSVWPTRSPDAPATVRDLLVSISPRRGSDRPPPARRGERAQRGRSDGLRPRARRVGRRRRLRRRGLLGRVLPTGARRAVRRRRRPATAHAERRRAEAAGAGGAVARQRRRAARSTSPTTSSTSPANDGSSASSSTSPRPCSFVSHDRELLAATATKIVTVEAVGAWVHGGGFAGYAEARRHHLETMRTIVRSYDAEKKRLEALVAEMRRRASFSEVFAPRLKAAESRLRLFLEKNERPSRCASSASTCSSAVGAPVSER